MQIFNKLISQKLDEWKKLTLLNIKLFNQLLKFNL